MQNRKKRRIAPRARILGKVSSQSLPFPTRRSADLHLIAKPCPPLRYGGREPSGICDDPRLPTAWSRGSDLGLSTTLMICTMARSSFAHLLNPGAKRVRLSHATSGLQH
jgi:hypothetical protein